MSRKLTYNLNRFDGGMTSSPRDVTQRDRFAYLSHFDIYRDTGKMYVMPGYVSDQDFFDGSTTTVNGAKQYNLKCFAYLGTTSIYALGTKSDGTGTKLLQRSTSEAYWKLASGADWQTEGTADLPQRPFLFFGGQAEFYYPAYTSPRVNLVEQGGNANAGAGGIDPDFGTLHVGNLQTGGAYVYEEGFDGSFYIPKNGYRNIAKLTTTGVYTQDIKTTAFGTYDVQSANYQLGIVGSFDKTSRATLWDSASLLADETLALGDRSCRVVGYPSNIWSYIVWEGDQGNALGNGQTRMVVKYAQGETIETRYFIDAPTTTNMVVIPTRGEYGNAMTWYGRIPTNTEGTTFIEGLWAFGKGVDTAQLGVCVLLDTSSLGEVITAYWHGKTTYFAHSDDGSVSRLDNFDTGTFDVKATAETVWYGNETPYQKELNGISVVTSPLPSGGQVEMFYRVNDSASWTSMGTSSTTGDMKHTFTRVAGVPIGKFQEIQFKFEVLGKVAVQNVFINLTETDSLAY